MKLVTIFVLLLFVVQEKHYLSPRVIHILKTRVAKLTFVLKGTSVSKGDEGVGWTFPRSIHLDLLIFIAFS